MGHAAGLSKQEIQYCKVPVSSLRSRVETQTEGEEGEEKKKKPKTELIVREND